MSPLGPHRKELPGDSNRVAPSAARPTSKQNESSLHPMSCRAAPYNSMISASAALAPYFGNAVFGTRLGTRTPVARKMCGPCCVTDHTSHQLALRRRGSKAVLPPGVGRRVLGVRRVPPSTVWAR
jgi:hypothetical protein